MVWPFTSSDPQHPSKTDSFYRFPDYMKAFLEDEAPLKPSTHDPVIPGNTPATAPPFNPVQFSKYGQKYADIWAQYKTPEMIDAEYRTPGVAVLEVLQSYKQRQSCIARAALENCIFQQMELHKCYGGKGVQGTIKQLTGCTKEMRSFEDCFQQQQELLLAMGYMIDWKRDPTIDEDIQMHADKLYREQVKKDRVMERRASQGLPIVDDASPTQGSAFVEDGKIAEQAAQALKDAGKGGEAAA